MTYNKNNLYKKLKFGQTDTMTVNVALLMGSWNWESLYSDGRNYTSSEFKSSLSIDGKNVKLDTPFDTLTGTWEYIKATDDGSQVYEFKVDNYDFDLNMIVDEHNIIVGAATDDTELVWLFSR